MTNSPERPNAKTTPEGEDPLAWLAAQSGHRRHMCAIMEALAVNLDHDGAATGQVISWLKTELPRVARYEIQDLFPLLESRARKMDDFNAVMGVLQRSHEANIATARRILSTLEPLHLMSRPATMDSVLSQSLKELAARERRHTSLLLAIILPIARLRLRKSDLAELANALNRPGNAPKYL